MFAIIDLETGEIFAGPIPEDRVNYIIEDLSAMYPYERIGVQDLKYRFTFSADVWLMLNR